MSAVILNKFMRMMGIGENDEENEYNDEVDLEILNHLILMQKIVIKAM